MRKYVSKNKNEDQTTYVGSRGELTVDPDTLSIKVHDGVTPGGTSIGDGGDVNNITGNLDITGSIIPTQDSVYSLGSPSSRWKDLYVSPGTIYIGNVKLSEINGTFNATTIIVDPETQEPVEVAKAGTSMAFAELTNKAVNAAPYSGDPISFTKTDYGSEVDEVAPGLHITRGDQQGIYNPLLEPGWDDIEAGDGDPSDTSPKNTEWNSAGWADLTNVSSRTYTTFYNSAGGALGSNVRNLYFVMHDKTNDKYYTFRFTVWGSYNVGASVTYTRQQIDPVTGASIGDPVTFEKPGYADPATTYDAIDTGITFARGNAYGLYNSAIESGYDNINGDGDDEDSPEGTEWNIDGWDNLYNVVDRTYTTFREILNNRIGENIIGAKLVMHDIANDQYWAIQFSSWTQGGNGGGFSYTRQLIDTSCWFVHSDYGDEVDYITEDVAITRGSSGGAIYNPLVEGYWDNDVSPTGTLWNLDGWDDFSDITSRTYTTFYNVFNQGGIGYKVVGAELIMYVPSIEQYYKVEFKSWTQNNNGGGFSYYRIPINKLELTEGIRFADGTVQTTASTPVKSTAFGNWKIVEKSGNSTVNITQKNYTNYNGMSIVNATIDSGNFRTTYDDNLWAALSATNYKAEISFDGGNSWQLVNGYSAGYQSYIDWYFDVDTSMSLSQNQPVAMRTWVGGEPQRWWQAPGDNFRGAIIEYHAFSRDAGTIIGTIHIACDDSDDNITHTETSSGGSDLGNIDLWYRGGNEDEIYARRLDSEDDTIKIHWTSRIFYGTETYD